MLRDEIDAFRKNTLGREVNFLSVAEEKELWSRWCTNHDAQARERILKSHLPLCRAIILEWARHSSVPVHDLFSEAMVAMLESFPDQYPALKGARHYNPNHESGARFCSFLRLPIERALRTYTINTASAVKLTTTAPQRIMFSNWKLLNEQVRRDSPGIGDQKRHEAIAALVTKRRAVTKINATDVREFEGRLKSQFMSLNTEVSGDPDSATFMDFLVAENGDIESYYEARDQESNLSRMQQALCSLSDRERDIITSRYLQENDKRNLTELGVQYGVSAERIRQIEVSALKKMRTLIAGEADKPGACVRVRQHIPVVA